jgi:membrane-associated tyrosine/threonine-specific cdc2-inhibitory kinase
LNAGAAALSLVVARGESAPAREASAREHQTRAMVGVAELPELPALAALKVSCAANDETPPARARSARSRAAYPDAGAKGSFDKNDASGAASRDDSLFDFAGTSPTPATFGVSPLSASPVPGDARWNLGAVGTSAKGPRTKISPVSVLTVSALDLSVSFEDEDDDDAMDVSRDVSRRPGHSSRSRLVCRGGGAFGDETRTNENSAVGSDRAFSRGNATFGASASFKLDRATDAKTSSATPLASPVAAHPSAGFGTPANVALVGGVGFGPFDAVPPTPARPRRLDAFDDEDDLAFGDAPEDDEDAWRLSDDSEELTEMDAMDAEMDDAPLPFSLAALDGEPDTNHGAAGGVARAAAAATRETATREQSTRTRWMRRPPARRKEPLPFRAPRLERADSLSQTKLLAQEGLHRSASLRADYHHRETESAPSVVGAEMAPSPATTTTTTRDASPPEDPERLSAAIGSAASPSKRAFAFHDHFEFRGLLGKTPTSEAWLVRSKVSGARYCVKRVTEAFRSGAQRARCLHEVQAVTHLPFHENVVQYHRAWQEDRHFFAQMELCERGSFGACLDRLRAHDRDRDPEDPFQTKEEEEEGGSSETVTRLVAERDVWRLARDVASGLAHCHAHGVLHLDVKPDNVFVARDGAYKIGDFGVAWVAGRGWEVQDGDGGYVAPETLNLHSAFFVKKVRSSELGDDDRGDANASVPTDRADVFSFGATLYEAACGARVPAEWRAGVPTWSDETANGANGLFTQKKKDDETRPRRYWDGLRFPAGRSDELRAYVSMCLRRDPTHRPSAADLAKHAAMIERTFVFGANARESGATRGE